MSHIELPEDTTARITIEAVGSDLRIRGWDRSAVSTDNDSADLAQTDDGTVVVHSSDDLALRVPIDAAITVGNVGSDAKITELEGPITLGNVGSDLILRKIGPVTVDAVGSDLRIKRVNGDVQIGTVGADLSIREVEGNTHIDKVGSDLYVRDIKGGCVAERVGADLVLSTDFLEGAEYRFEVGADIVCRLAPDANVRIRILECADLAIDAPGAELSEEGDYDEITFGEGAALVELSAGADIRLVGQDEDYMMAINFQLEEELAARLSGIEERLTEQLAGLDDLLANKAERIRQKAEKQAERAMRHAERVARQTERKMDMSKRKRMFTLSFGGGHGPRPARPPRPSRPEPPQPPREPITNEERMMILRMVENKQISVEEAEKLLAALES